MTGWIVIAVLYLLNLALIRWLGGVAAAGEAFQRWGRWSTTVSRARRSTSSSSPRR